MISEVYKLEIIKFIYDDVEEIEGHAVKMREKGYGVRNTETTRNGIEIEYYKYIK